MFTLFYPIRYPRKFSSQNNKIYFILLLIIIIKIFTKNHLPFLPFSLSIGKKMSKKFVSQFFKKYFKNMSIMVRVMKKNKKFHIFFEKSKN